MFVAQAISFCFLRIGSTCLEYGEITVNACSSCLPFPTSNQTPNTSFLRLLISACIGDFIQEPEGFALAVVPRSALTSHGRR